jgi:uncharacterized membrane protein YphA (DoxX/SURF4 family)
MKKINIIYWISTVLLAAMMLFSGVMSIIDGPQSAQFMAMLHYPPYFDSYLGVIKVLGVIALFVPGFPRIREWAYAGFTFDLVSALYSLIMSHLRFADWVLIPVFIVILAVSYVCWHKKLKAAGNKDSVV